MIFPNINLATSLSVSAFSLTFRLNSGHHFCADFFGISITLLWLLSSYLACWTWDGILDLSWKVGKCLQSWEKKYIRQYWKKSAGVVAHLAECWYCMHKAWVQVASLQQKVGKQARQQGHGGTCLWSQHSGGWGRRVWSSRSPLAI